MGLRTQLYALTEPRLAPCYRDDFRSDYTKQTIAETAYRIPLPWLAMFRVEDLREERIEFHEDDGPVTYIAPVAKMDDAKKNLLDARAAVRRSFPQCPLLVNYFEVMVEELALFDYPFVTIDATELYPEIMARGQLSRPWEAVLSGFADPDAVSSYVPVTLGDRVGAIFGRRRQEPWLTAINNFVEFSPDQSLPRPDYCSRGDTPSADERERHAALLPEGVYHTSVWNSK